MGDTFEEIINNNKPIDIRENDLIILINAARAVDQIPNIGATNDEIADREFYYNALKQEIQKNIDKSIKKSKIKKYKNMLTKVSTKFVEITDKENAAKAEAKAAKKKQEEAAAKQANAAAEATRKEQKNIIEDINTSIPVDRYVSFSNNSSRATGISNNEIKEYDYNVFNTTRLPANSQQIKLGGSRKKSKRKKLKRKKTRRKKSKRKKTRRKYKRRK
jgi:transketolase